MESGKNEKGYAKTVRRSIQRLFFADGSSNGFEGLTEPTDDGKNSPNQCFAYSWAIASEP